HESVAIEIGWRGGAGEGHIDRRKNHSCAAEEQTIEVVSQRQHIRNTIAVEVRGRGPTTQLGHKRGDRAKVESARTPPNLDRAVSLVIQDQVRELVLIEIGDVLDPICRPSPGAGDRLESVSVAPINNLPETA